MLRTNRRPSSLLAALLFTTLGVAAYGGPLTPEPGPVVSTHKTLTEVEPRIPISAATTPGDADSRFRIFQKGSYYLTAPIQGQVGLAGIEIATGGVTIDLNGFDMLGVPGSLDGIRSTIGGQHNVTIKNGSLRFWGQDGIDLETASNSAVRIENVQSSNNGARGIAIYAGVIQSCQAFNNSAQGISIESGMIKDCHASFNDLTGLWVTGDGSSVIGCTAIDNSTNGIFVGESALVQQCVVRDNGDVGVTTGAGSTVRDCISDENLVHGYVLGATSSITNSTARENREHGIIANGNSLVIGNLAVGNGVNGATFAGIRVQGGNSRVERNNSTNNPRGVEVVGAGNFVVSNTCADNTTNWIIAANNVYGVVMNRTAPGAPAVNGNSSGGDEAGTMNPYANFSY